MSWNKEQIDAVWQKGRVVDGYDQDKYRLDACDAWMARDHYGEQTVYGWEIDHVFPQSIAKKRGYSQEEIDILDNLRPMNWRNNKRKDDDYPSYVSAVTRSNNRNIEFEQSKTVNDWYRLRLDPAFKIRRAG